MLSAFACQSEIGVVESERPIGEGSTVTSHRLCRKLKAGPRANVICQFRVLDGRSNPAPSCASQ